MNAEKFKEIYNESRNGCNQLYHHSLVRKFNYTDGVRDLAKEGCYWLIDMLATELPAKFRKHAEVSNSCIVSVKVKHTKAVLTASFADGKVGWTKRIEYTDMPEGVWNFEAVDEGDRIIMSLISEH